MGLYEGHSHEEEKLRPMKRMKKSKLKMKLLWEEDEMVVGQTRLLMVMEKKMCQHPEQEMLLKKTWKKDRAPFVHYCPDA